MAEEASVTRGTARTAPVGSTTGVRARLGVTRRAIIAGPGPDSSERHLHRPRHDAPGRLPLHRAATACSSTRSQCFSCLSLLNQGLRRRRPQWAFGSGEMLTIYLMLGVSTGLISSAFDLGGSLAGTITYPFWFATKENRWRELLWPNLPAVADDAGPGVAGELLRRRGQPVHLVGLPPLAHPGALVRGLRRAR